MTTVVRSVRRALAPPTLLALGITVAVSLLLVGQITHPSSRVLKAAGGLALLVIAFRFHPTTSLVFFILAFPFPFQVYLGTSNILFVLLLTGVALARIALGEYRPPVRTPLDLPIATLLVIYLVSFYHTRDLANLRGSILALVPILCSILFYYLIVNYVRNEAALRRVTNAAGVTIVLSNLTALYEILFPGRVLIPHWILVTKPEAALLRSGFRIGGPFRDFELYCEFTAVALPILFFLVAHARSRSIRNFWIANVVLDVIGMFSTVTRGGVIAAALGIAYLLFRMRRRITITAFVGILAAVVVLPILVDEFLTQHTTTGSTFRRIAGTEFIGGIPESRSHWPEIYERTREHVWIGHGPYYDFGQYVDVRGHGLYKFAWPHNIYLWYLYTVGWIGLTAFLFLAGRILQLSSRWAADRLNAAYPASLLLALHVALVIFLVDQGKVDYLRNASYQFWPWILIGLIIASVRILEAGRAGAASFPSSGPVRER